MDSSKLQGITRMTKTWSVLNPQVSHLLVSEERKLSSVAHLPITTHRPKEDRRLPNHFSFYKLNFKDLPQQSPTYPEMSPISLPVPTHPKSARVCFWRQLFFYVRCPINLGEIDWFWMILMIFLPEFHWDVERFLRGVAYLYYLLGGLTSLWRPDSRL